MPPWTNERARGRALTLAAEGLETLARQYRDEARALVRELPPGSFARDIRTGKMLVVRQQGGATMLDEFTDRGMREAEDSDWFFLDLVEEGK